MLTVERNWDHTRDYDMTDMKKVHIKQYYFEVLLYFSPQLQDMKAKASVYLFHSVSVDVTVLLRKVTNHSIFTLLKVNTPLL